MNKFRKREPSLKKYAAVDLGSNTVRLLIAEVQLSDRASLVPIKVDRSITRLGESFECDKFLKPVPVRRTISALKKFRQTIETHAVSKERIAATAVVREAKNRDWFVQEVRKQTSMCVEVLTGEEEAQLSLKGVFRALTDVEPPSLVIDIGGGSTEVVICDPMQTVQIHYCKSIDLGVVKLTEAFLPHDPPRKEKCRELYDRVKRVIGNIKEEIAENLAHCSGSSIVRSFIGTAGTPTTLAAMYLKMVDYDPLRITGTVLSYKYLKELELALAEMPLKERQEIPGLEKGREDLILAGLIIVLSFMEQFNLNRMTVSDAGLLEGLIWDMIEGDFVENFKSTSSYNITPIASI